MVQNLAKENSGTKFRDFHTIKQGMMDMERNRCGVHQLNGINQLNKLYHQNKTGNKVLSSLIERVEFLIEILFSIKAF